MAVAGERVALTEEAFVLAGGSSSRMGRPKADLPYLGATFLENAVRTLRDAGLAARIVASRGQTFEFRGAELVYDSFEGAGPLGGIHAALRHSNSTLTYLLPCDLPRIGSPFVHVLRRLAGEHDFVVPRDGVGRLHPLCGVYSPRCLVVAERLLEGGKHRVERLVGSAELRGSVFSAADLGIPDEWFRNVNTPADYSALLEPRG